jgi:nicotinamidase-related amidase
MESDMQENKSKLMHLLAVAAVLSTTGFAVATARAADIVTEWANVKAPPAPELKPVTVDPKTTALLMLDFLQANCGHAQRCPATLPLVKKLLDEARAKNMLVVYTAFGKFSAKDVLPEVAPKGNEPFVVSFLDKYLGTDLEKILKDAGIKTVIPVGSAANGAVFGTASASAQRGFEVIIPVDGMSSDDLYAEQSAAWNLVHAPVIAAKDTLTRIDMIKF